jgi:hypothetical protein
MFYGITLLLLPRIAKTDCIYKATPAQLGSFIEEIGFESEEPTDFIGIFKEFFDMETHFEERLWLAVQCGDANASNNWYEKLMDKCGFDKSEKTSPNRTGFFNMFHDDGMNLYYGDTQEAVREKRLNVIKEILLKFDIEYSVLEMNGSKLYHQERNSIRSSDDGSVFFLLFGCFVVEQADVFIMNSPQRGIFRVEVEDSKMFRESYAGAVPYDTGYVPASLSRSIVVKDKIPCPIGPPEMLNSCAMRPTTTEFKRKLGLMGISLLGSTGQLHPVVYRMFAQN